MSVEIEPRLLRPHPDARPAEPRPEAPAAPSAPQASGAPVAGLHDRAGGPAPLSEAPANRRRSRHRRPAYRSPHVEPLGLLAMAIAVLLLVFFSLLMA